MNQDNTKSDEIDVLALLHKLWTKKLLILFTAFYFAAFSFLGTYFFIQPTYTSTTRIYVVNQATDNKNLSAQDLQAGTYLANDYEVASEKIKKVTKVEDVTTLEEAKLPESPSSPNIKRNVLLGAVLGGFLAVVGVLVREILDDRVRRPEDVEDALGMTLLGIVPDTDKI